MLKSIPVINQFGITPGVAGRDRNDLVIGSLVKLTNGDNNGISKWTWSFVSKPPNSTASLKNPNSYKSSFTPDKIGTYVLKLVVGSNTESVSSTIRAIVKTSNMGLTIPNMEDSVDTWNAFHYGSIQVIDSYAVGGSGSSESINNIADFIGMLDPEASEMPTYTSTNYVSQGSSLETAISTLDSTIELVDLSNLGSFVGMSNPETTEMPTYTSTRFISQNASLEAAISELDLAIDDLSPPLYVAHDSDELVELLEDTTPMTILLEAKSYAIQKAVLVTAPKVIRGTGIESNPTLETTSNSSRIVIGGGGGFNQYISFSNNVIIENIHFTIHASGNDATRLLLFPSGSGQYFYQGIIRNCNFSNNSRSFYYFIECSKYNVNITDNNFYINGSIASTNQCIKINNDKCKITNNHFYINNTGTSTSPVIFVDSGAEETMISNNIFDFINSSSLLRAIGIDQTDTVVITSNVFNIYTPVNKVLYSTGNKGSNILFSNNIVTCIGTSSGDTDYIIGGQIDNLTITNNQFYECDVNYAETSRPSSSIYSGIIALYNSSYIIISNNYFSGVPFCFISLRYGVNLCEITNNIFNLHQIYSAANKKYCVFIHRYSTASDSAHEISICNNTLSSTSSSVSNTLGLSTMKKDSLTFLGTTYESEIALRESDDFLNITFLNNKYPQGLYTIIDWDGFGYQLFTDVIRPKTDISSATSQYLQIRPADKRIDVDDTDYNVIIETPYDHGSGRRNENFIIRRMDSSANTVTLRDFNYNTEVLEETGGKLIQNSRMWLFTDRIIYWITSNNYLFTYDIDNDDFSSSHPTVYDKEETYYEWCAEGATDIYKIIYKPNSDTPSLRLRSVATSSHGEIDSPDPTMEVLSVYVDDAEDFLYCTTELNHVFKYDLTAETWADTNHPVPVGTGAACPSKYLVLYDDYVIDIRNGHTGTIYMYEISADTWTSVNISALSISGTFKRGFVYDNVFYLFTSSGKLFSFDGTDWTYKGQGTIGGDIVANMACFHYGNQLYIVGVVSVNVDDYSNGMMTLGRYDLDLERWSIINNDISNIGTTSLYPGDVFDGVGDDTTNACYLTINDYLVKLQKRTIDGANTKDITTGVNKFMFDGTDWWTI